MPSDKIDHLLRIIWTAQEKNSPTLEEIKKEFQQGKAEDVLSRMEKEGYVELHNGEVTLTPIGKRAAEEIIRRYRLAERLFADLLEIPASDYQMLACNFEHILSPEVTDSVCTFLGHPRVCPHNRPIPRGKCCIAYLDNVKPLVQPLVTLPLGQKARIVYMFPSHRKRWGKLHQFGLYPGNTIKLIQKRPSYVVEVDGTTLALDDEICREIYVKKLSD